MKVTSLLTFLVASATLGSVALAERYSEQWLGQGLKLVSPGITYRKMHGCKDQDRVEFKADNDWKDDDHLGGRDRDSVRISESGIDHVLIKAQNQRGDYDSIKIYRARISFKNPFTADQVVDFPAGLVLAEKEGLAINVFGNNRSIDKITLVMGNNGGLGEKDKAVAFLCKQ